MSSRYKMGYNKENFRRIKNEYATKRLRAQEMAAQRQDEIESRIPELLDVDRELSQCGLKIFKAALSPNSEKAIAEIRARNMELQDRRAQLLVQAGYPKNYTDVQYECPTCGDTGYVNCVMCSCMKRALVMAAYETSGLGQLMHSQSFDNFNLDYYRVGGDAYQIMTKTYEGLKEYAETFCLNQNQHPDSLLLLGNTGLGKTHLTTSMAKVIIERGYDVKYVSAVGMLSDFERERFGNSMAEDSSEELQNYYNCDLLMIDDLGTEVNNQFTVSCLHNVINVRLNKGLPTVISTNLTMKDIRDRYWDRITSRLMGEYRLLFFKGVDIRMQKLI